MMIVFMGADGSGKSSVIEGIRQALSAKFEGVEVFHLKLPLPFLKDRLRDPSSVTDPHGQVPYNPVLSVVKLLYLLLLYIIGYCLHLKKICSDNRLIILDRYYYDLLVDPKRFRYGGPLWLATLSGRLIPKPQLVFLLLASPELLQSRKQEVSFAETSRQCEIYEQLSHVLSNTIVLDASRPLGSLVEEAGHHILRAASV